MEKIAENTALCRTILSWPFHLVAQTSMSRTRLWPIQRAGLCLLMSAKFVGIKFYKAMLASLPIYVIFFAAIGFTIFFPEVVLWLPRKLLPQSGRLLRQSRG